MAEQIYKPEDCPEHQFWIKSSRIKWIVPTNQCQLCGAFRTVQK